jgi:Protein of unknown function, DUF481
MFPQKYLVHLLVISCICGSLSSFGISQAAPPAGTSGDEVVLKNGDKLTGGSITATKSSVTFASEYTGVVDIEWKNIKSLHIHNRVIYPGRSCRSNCPSAQTVLDDATVTVLNDGKAIKIEPGYINGLQVANIQSIGGPPSKCPGGSGGVPGPQILTFKIQLGLLSATQHQQTYGGEFDAAENWHPKECGWPRQRTFLQLIPSYDDKKGKKPPANITQNYDGKLQHLLFLQNNKYFAAINTDFYHNNSLGIYFQQTYSLGFGALLRNGHAEVDAGVAGLGEHFYSPGRSVGLVGLRLSERYDIPLDFIKENARLSELGTFFPVFNESAAWQVRGVLELNVPISKRFSLTAGAFEDYVRNAPSTFTKNYVKSTLGLQYSVGGK